MRFLILGAGPAGLSFACKLKKAGIDDFLVLEKEIMAGGLCRSTLVDGAPFDIGGGHFLDVRKPKVNEFLFQFMPCDEWNLFTRDSRIKLNGFLINHPLESNIWQLDIDSQVEFLKSIAVAGCNVGNKKPKKFVDWIYWKLGNKIAEDYMIPYNQKMFGKELNDLGTYWLEKLPNVSFEETLLSCLNKKPYGTQPGHAQFYYPKKYGYGELWNRMAHYLSGHIVFGKSVCELDYEQKAVTTLDGQIYKSDIIVTTIPWIEFKRIKGMPKTLFKKIKKLKYSSIQTEYFSESLNTSCHWIYYPDLSLSYHRVLVRHNFCSNSKGYWTETNSDRVKKDSNSQFSYFNKYAYPLNTIDKPTIMEELLSFSKERSVYGLGRWGEHQHYNSDVTVDLAMKLADSFIKNENK